MRNVSDTIPEGHTVIDCGAALDCTGEEAAARTAQALEARGEVRVAECVDKQQDFRFGGGEPQRAGLRHPGRRELGDLMTNDS